ncbi:MAG: ABC transporter permease, partial [Planctomycetes bacterium]|nr:ABC transporter permease [Planctomycetota bacterium]
MSKFRLLIQSLVFYRRSNLAVMLGVIAGTAVIGGALIVGDSVRGSLEQMTYDRLGKIDHVLTGPRFFRESLVEDLAADAEFQKRFTAAAPALVLTAGLDSASAQPQAERTIRRVGKVSVYGVDRRLWELLDHGKVAVPQDREGEKNEIVLSRRVARQLDVTEGKTVNVSIELPT